jgi:hypothetical protein
MVVVPSDFMTFRLAKLYPSDNILIAMVDLKVARQSNFDLVRNRHLVAVFFGGTSGIGHYTLRALSRASENGGKGFRAYIVGRKAKAAESIV